MDGVSAVERRQDPCSIVSLTESVVAARRAHTRRRAFVVDDDPATRRLLGDVATELGWESERFATLRSLRAALERDVPDVIILDDELPDGRGGDFAIEVRSSTRLRRTPIIFCTAAEPTRRREIGRLAPVLGKPFDLARFERLLDE
ncbi:MAG TPA: response regulator, partial [Candidatus Limnocylindria bacterium]|nr:response regulator [Candidatus Limnocylindria bacterium]